MSPDVGQYYANQRRQLVDEQRQILRKIADDVTKAAQEREATLLAQVREKVAGLDVVAAELAKLAAAYNLVSRGAWDGPVTIADAVDTALDGGSFLVDPTQPPPKPAPKPVPMEQNPFATRRIGPRELQY